MTRPTVNLDAVAGVLDRVLAHPTAQAAEPFMPETFERLRKVRENLPDFVSGVEARATEVIAREVKALERDFLSEIGGFIDGAFRAGKRRDRAAKPTKKKKTKRIAR